MDEIYEKLKAEVPEFRGFGKIPRLNKDIVITEKIDGTNAQIVITRDTETLEYKIFAGSRKRWIFPGDDNYTFASWVYGNKEKLIEILGEGVHFGEWWGQGIQRKYNMDKKVFSLFNTNRWEEIDALDGQLQCVPVLCKHTFDSIIINRAIHMLKQDGSHAAPGFMDPEGIMIYHSAGNCLFKNPFDENHKGNKN